MKYLLIFVILFGCIEANAKMKRFLVPCSDGSGVCNVGSTQTPKGMICQVQSEDDGSLYDVKIIKGQNLGLIDRARDFLGLEVESMRDWAPGETLKPDERILCRVDQSKKQAKLDLREAKEKAQEKLKENKQAAWKTACENNEIHPLICKERGL